MNHCESCCGFVTLARTSILWRKVKLHIWYLWWLPPTSTWNTLTHTQHHTVTRTRTHTHHTHNLIDPLGESNSTLTHTHTHPHCRMFKITLAFLLLSVYAEGKPCPKPKCAQVREDCPALNIPVVDGCERCPKCLDEINKCEGNCDYEYGLNLSGDDRCYCQPWCIQAGNCCDDFFSKCGGPKYFYAREKNITSPMKWFDFPPSNGINHSSGIFVPDTTKKGGMAAFYVNATKKTKVRLEGKVATEGRKHNSFRVQFNNPNPKTGYVWKINHFGKQSAWKTVGKGKGKQFSLKAGVNTLYIKQRETLTRLERLHITDVTDGDAFFTTWKGSAISSSKLAKATKSQERKRSTRCSLRPWFPHHLLLWGHIQLRPRCCPLWWYWVCTTSCNVVAHGTGYVLRAVTLWLNAGFRHSNHH